MSTDVQIGPEVACPPALAGGASMRPPAIVMNLFYSGLGIARDLAGSGVRVVGLSSERHGYGNHSRCCEVRFAPNSQTEPERMFAYLQALPADLDGSVIFPTRDADVVLLDRCRKDLTARFRLAVPPSACLRQVLDKDALAAIAAAAGIPVPRTVQIHNRAELECVPAQVGFPCVLKPVSSVDWRRGDNWNLVGARKALRVDNWDELQREYAQVSVATPSILIQEWIPGPTDQIVVMAGYVNSNSEPAAFFTARKLIQSPDDFGTGCVVASEPIPAVHDITFRLWKILRYAGMAEVEYKFDARTGQYRLIEINTRHWDQHRLAQASGINLTWLAYCDLIGEPQAPPRRPTVPATWIAEDALFWYILRTAWRHELRLRVLVGKLRGQRMYGIACWNDPVPLLRRAGATFLEAVRAIAGKLGRRAE